MSATLIFLAVLLAAFLGWIVRQSISVAPWVAGPPGRNSPDHLPPAATAARVGLGVFLAAITSFFMIGISAYLLRMEMGRDWIPVSAPGLLWVNTVILVLGSVSLQRAWNAARRKDIGQVRFGLLAGGAFTMAFIAGQLMVWWQLNDAGHYLVGNPASSFFYLFTALHGLHLLGGMVAWIRTLLRVRRGDAPAKIQVSVELCTLYWHFLLMVWLGLFGLLLYT
jgi:cytochrome c oxidase subunit III